MNIRESRVQQIQYTSFHNRSVGKETGETAHVERWNNTLRQRLGRFTRKTLSFSKLKSMHETCLRLFIHQYNQELATIPT